MIAFGATSIGFPRPLPSNDNGKKFNLGWVLPCKTKGGFVNGFWVDAEGIGYSAKQGAERPKGKNCCGGFASTQQFLGIV